jgi:hypothetical protein
MDSYLAPVLASVVYRILELQPQIGRDEAITQAQSILKESDLVGISEIDLDARIAEVCGRYRRKGVINPLWLKSRGLRAHFFLANARPGWLEHLISETEQGMRGISRYIVYGEYDSLVILNGTDAEAEQQAAVFQNDIYANSLSFSADSTLLSYRQHVRPVAADAPDVDPQQVNAIAEDFDRPDMLELRSELVRSRILLGPVWLPEEHPRERLIAFVGLELRGRQPVRPDDMLNALLSHKAVERTLVHLFETDDHPYKYFAKLVCKDQDELDRATTAIGTIHFGRVHVEGNTMVVAQGFDRLPVYRFASRGTLGKLGELPELEDVEAVAIEMVRAIGPDAPRRFNELQSPLKLGTLGAIARIREQFDGARPRPGEANGDDGEDGGEPDFRELSPDWLKGLKEAERQFGNGALDGAGAGLDGAVSAATNTVELAAKRAVRLLAESAFGLDYATAQKELRLPGKDFRKLTLGNIVQAFGTMRENKRFEALWPALESSRLEALAMFTEERNRWAHGDKQELSASERVHSAAEVIVRAIELSCWLDVEFIQALPDSRSGARGAESPPSPWRSIVLPEARPDRRLGFFISHSSKDKEIARRISEAIRALGLKVFFDEWSIDASDSIVQKISQEIVKHDTVALLLSPNSVDSRWVQKELDAALMAQLSGADVKVLPLLVEDCEIPPLLADIKYIDFRNSFEDAFIEVIQYIKRRRNPPAAGRDS